MWFHLNYVCLSHICIEMESTKESTFENNLHVYIMRTSTGWRRLIGSPKLQIIFHKRATKYRSLLRKMTYEDKGSYESSPPCIYNYKCTFFVGFHLNWNGIYLYVGSLPLELCCRRSSAQKLRQSIHRYHHMNM